MSIDNQPDLFEYLTEASKTVSDWPTWKQSGSDATQFQENRKNTNTYTKDNNACFVLKRTSIS
ncbi:TPA: hypothetical protein U2J86_005081 [Serratia marcescens]|uniref:hypothetical protein n=1 Tax=Proteus TaxID=583 RepID=UPI000D68C8F3|nr:MULTISPECIES: hypothetical protein [Proteus]MBQ0215196.1 hypothetical protein [Proteus vulgaris]NBM53682.1 hypothetical protein [Proteus sp. G2669]HEM7578029.1 hypothetical protein [Serratia marcescens]